MRNHFTASEWTSSDQRVRMPKDRKLPTLLADVGPGTCVSLSELEVQILGLKEILARDSHLAD